MAEETKPQEEKKEETKQPEVKQPAIKKTAEVELSLEDRMKGFNSDVLALLGKWKVGLSAEAFINRGLIFARPILVDDSEQPKEEEKTEEIKAVDPKAPVEVKVEDKKQEANLGESQ